jgi:hypothetical protein
VEPASPAAAPVAAEAAPTAAIPPAVLQQAPEAAPPAIAAPAGPGARVLFEDRFQDGPRLWPSDPLGPARYESTGYRLYAREAGQFVALGAPFRQPLRDALITASFTKVGGPAGGIYGLIVRDSGPEPRDGTNQIGNFYVLGVDDRGQYGVWRREGSRWVDIVPLTPSDAVRPGSATNELTALAFDDHLSLTVNGVEVATVLGTEPRPGGVGVYVAGDLNEVQLNRFEVQPATSASAPAATPVVEVAGAVDARPAEVGTVDARPADLGTLDTPAAETRPGTTRAPAGFSAAVLRAEPSTSSRALASLPNGTAIDVLPVSATGSGFTWLRVRTRVGTLGWMVSTAVAV